LGKESKQVGGPLLIKLLLGTACYCFAGFAVGYFGKKLWRLISE
jgi:hypothetical protein